MTDNPSGRRYLSLVLFLFMIGFLVAVFAGGPLWAEGERYDRLEVPSPAEKAKEEDLCVSSARIQVIVSAFTRVNRGLDQTIAASYASHVLEASESFGIHPFMIASIIIRESTVKPNARSRYAYGLMQINWKAHRNGLKKAFSQIQTLEDLLKPRNNILAGTWIFSWYLKSSNGDIKKALAKYLGRTGSKYINRVLAGYNAMLQEFEKNQDLVRTQIADISPSMACAVE
jgi:soluble lytic murein transglycosylase-like protein